MKVILEHKGHTIDESFEVLWLLKEPVLFKKFGGKVSNPRIRRECVLAS